MTKKLPTFQEAEQMKVYNFKIKCARPSCEKVYGSDYLRNEGVCPYCRRLKRKGLFITQNIKTDDDALGDIMREIARR